MAPHEAARNFQMACVNDREGRYFFSCKSAAVIVRLRGLHGPLSFPARARFRFRIDPDALQVERLDSGAIYLSIPWEDIESLAAGEPEMAGGALFQGRLI